MGKRIFSEIRTKIYLDLIGCQYTTPHDMTLKLLGFIIRSQEEAIIRSHHQNRLHNWPHAARRRSLPAAGLTGLLDCAAWFHVRRHSLPHFKKQALTVLAPWYCPLTIATYIGRWSFCHPRRHKRFLPLALKVFLSRVPVLSGQKARGLLSTSTRDCYYDSDPRPIFA